MAKKRTLSPSDLLSTPLALIATSAIRFPRWTFAGRRGQLVASFRPTGHKCHRCWLFNRRRASRGAGRKSVRTVVCQVLGN